MSMRKAKIVCTIGPASSSPAIVNRLIESGMDVARLNFSHGTHESHATAITAIRNAAAQRGSEVAIIQDLQGPRIRVGQVPKAGIEVRPGQTVRLHTSTPHHGHRDAQSAALSPLLEIPVTYSSLGRDLQVGARVLINDGLIELITERIADDLVYCTVLAGGTITSHKGINLPGTHVSAPTLTEKDRDDIRFGVEQGVDYVALSFVRGPQDIRAARTLLAEHGTTTPIIAKIERAEAVATLDEILEQADGVMIARGDMGVEMGPEAVPLLQKRIIIEANRRRRLVITATQMLESMTQAIRPTRAEASDVANAFFDGTDALMLSAETAVGAHPVETLQVMDRIIRAAEEGTEQGVVFKRQADLEHLSISESICAAASFAARATDATAIVAFSESGTTVRLISKQRPSAPIFAFTHAEAVKRRLALYWGVRSFIMLRIGETDPHIREAEQRLKAEGLVNKGDRVVIVSGTMAAQIGGTNLLKLHEIR
ncbi:pyruvate kinase [Nitrospira sp. BLG_2]|uniref:pyruvate kinase n=1 Tax=Nitrospira sp. BLG_2 TaxID=3397507 RepID=UPI003B9AD27F